MKLITGVSGGVSFVLWHDLRGYGEVTIIEQSGVGFRFENEEGGGTIIYWTR
jgi:hypothetical protein